MELDETFVKFREDLRILLTLNYSLREDLNGIIGDRTLTSKKDLIGDWERWKLP